MRRLSPAWFSRFNCTVLAASLTSFAAVPSPVTAAELRVDLDISGRQSSEVTQSGYTPWAIAGTSGNAAASQTFAEAGVTVSFAMSGSVGTGLRSSWYKAGVQAGTKLAGDGITVADGNGGSAIVMRISGLSAGPHTLLTYHNAWDNLAAGAQGRIDISVDGALVIDSLQPTIRAVNNSDATVAYLEFEAVAGQDVVILFAAELIGGATVKNPVINAFEIDTPNSTRQAQLPSPADGDEHVDADTGSVTLSWTPASAGTAVSHDVYFGFDAAAVEAATHASPEFLSNQSGTSRAISGLPRNAACHWRVDEIDALGNVTRGEVWFFRVRQLAFPGAEGHGRFAIGGRGGRVVHVTSLADYGSGDTPIPGTLRHAVEEESGPRTIVFDVSGLITLGSRLTLNDPHVTVAGQTAPGKGICIRGWALGLSGARDAIVRFIRNRPGNISGQTIDGGGLAGCDHSIMDHCSISWSIDEGFSSRSAKNITLQRTLISEALNIAGHQNYPAGTAHGYAATIGGDKGSFHHNLLAHCAGRNWSLGGGLDANNTFAGRLDIRNNVVYNWRSRTTDGGAMEVNFVNNTYQPGAATTLVPWALTINHEDNFAGSQRAYFAGNVMPGHFDETNQTAGRRSVVSSGVPTPNYETFVDAPFFESHVTTQTARAAYKRVLSDVGANRPIDDHDARVIGETLAGTYTYTGTGPYGGYPGLPNSQDDVGGWEYYPEVRRPAGWDTDADGLPDWWEQLHGSDPASPAGDFSDANADLDGDGYTGLEVYLAWLALPRVTCAPDAFVDIDLALLTRGYTATPVHAVSDAVNGSVELLADGHTARFTPAAGFTGLAGFTFSVTDSTGDSMTGEVAVRVVAPPAAQLAITAGAGLAGGVLEDAPLGLEFTGAPGQPYTIQTSTDLAAWTDWAAVDGSGDVELLAVDETLATAPRRFFRAVTP